MTAKLEQIRPLHRRAPHRGRSGRSAPVYNPALGVAAMEVALASAEETRAAISRRAAALAEWSETPRAAARARTVPLPRARRQARRRARRPDHARARQGARRTRRGEVTRGLEIVRVRLRHPRICSRANTPTHVGRGIDSWSLRQPLGVCAGITPFNFPAMVPMWMFPIAIACGNTFVLKPSEKRPGLPDAPGGTA